MASPVIDFNRLAELLDRLDPTPSLHCTVPGCTHGDSPQREEVGRPPWLLAA